MDIIMRRNTRVTTTDTIMRRNTRVTTTEDIIMRRNTRGTTTEDTIMRRNMETINMMRNTRITITMSMVITIMMTVLLQPKKENMNKLPNRLWLLKANVRYDDSAFYFVYSKISLL